MRTSSPEPGATTAASSPTPTRTSGPAPDRTLRIASSSSGSVMSTVLSVPYKSSRCIGSQLRRRRPERRSVDSQPYSGMSKRPGHAQPQASRNEEAPSWQRFTSTPRPEQLRAFTEEMPETRISEFGNINAQTQVLSRSAASTHVVDRESSGKTMTRERVRRDRRAAGRLHRRTRHGRRSTATSATTPRCAPPPACSIEKRNANIAGMQQKLYFERDDGAEPRGAGHLHAGPQGRTGLSGRPPDRRRPRQLRDARPQLRLLR